MAYAESADVQARVGRLSSAWTDSSRPSLADVDRMIDDAAAAIDAVLTQYGVTEPLPEGSVGALALRPLNAKMAALDALQATFPSANGPNEARELIDQLRVQVLGTNGAGGDWGLLLAGGHPAVVAIRESGSGNVEASSFWTNEPEYGMWPRSPEDWLYTNPQLLPYWSRLSRF